MTKVPTRTGTRNSTAHLDDLAQRRMVWRKAMTKVSRVNGCWLWTDRLNADGYGHLRCMGGVQVSAHRAVYELYRDVVVLPQFDLDHLCRVRHCVNPDHLEPVDRMTNLGRGNVGVWVFGRCRNGHDVTDPANVYVRKDTGRRCCRACATERNRRRK